jgi:hypothetical protein
MTKQCRTVNDSNKLFAKAKGEAEKGQIVEIPGAVRPDFIFPESLVTLGSAERRGGRISHLNEATIQGTAREIKGDYGIICVTIVPASRDREGVKHTEFTASANPSLRVYRHVEKSKICDLVSVKGPVRPDGSIYPFFSRNISVYFEQLPTTVAASCRR